MAQQRVGTDGIIGEKGNANAGCDGKFPPFDMNGLGNEMKQARKNPSALFGIDEVGKKEHKFVATQARDSVSTAYSGGKPLADLD